MPTSNSGRASGGNKSNSGKGTGGNKSNAGTRPATDQENVQEQASPTVHKEDINTETKE